MALALLAVLSCGGLVSCEAQAEPEPEPVPIPLVDWTVAEYQIQATVLADMPPEEFALLSDLPAEELPTQPLSLDNLMGEDVWREQLEAVTAAQDGAHVSVLLTHRPERVEDYTGRGFDLVLAGHAHGGQWRLPGLINGLIAPNQGLFPRYAGGRYALDGDTTMIVSRGLARESTRIPRLFNRPELVVVDILPEGTA